MTKAAFFVGMFFRALLKSKKKEDAGWFRPAVAEAYPITSRRIGFVSEPRTEDMVSRYHVTV
jgi:hypothetical protein